MIVKDLLKLCTKEEFLAACVRQEPYIENCAEKFSRTWDWAQKTDPTLTTDNIIICCEQMTEDDLYLSCTRYDKKEIKDFFKNSDICVETLRSWDLPHYNWNVEKSPWPEMLGTEVDENSLRYGAADILASLFSFISSCRGFTEEEFAAYVDQFNESFQACVDNPSPENIEKHLKVASGKEELWFDISDPNPLGRLVSLFDSIRISDQIHSVDPNITEISINLDFLFGMEDASQGTDCDDVYDDIDSVDEESLTEDAYERIPLPHVYNDYLQKNTAAKFEAIKSYYERKLTPPTA